MEYNNITVEGLSIFYGKVWFPRYILEQIMLYFQCMKKYRSSYK